MTYLNNQRRLAAPALLVGLSFAAFTACGGSNSENESGDGDGDAATGGMAGDGDGDGDGDGTSGGSSGDGDGDDGSGGTNAAGGTGGAGPDGDGGSSMGGADGDGFSCPAQGEGVASGNSAISGILSVDTFFGSVVGTRNAAEAANDEVRGALDDIALSLGLEAGSSISEIRATLEAKIAANIEGSLRIDAETVKCLISSAEVLDAAVACDASLDRNLVSVECSGSCETLVEENGNIECPADATVFCRTDETNAQCQGTCVGDCELSAASSCDGTCQGTCDGTCTKDGAGGTCDGSCDANCEGTCLVESGGECLGSCTGECTYSPPDSSCPTGSTVVCRANAQSGSSVECSGQCSGRVVAPSSSTDCEVSVEADSMIAMECSLPGLDATFQFDSSLDASGKADFLAWLEGFKEDYATLSSALEKADIIVAVASDLGAAASGAVPAAWQSASSSSDDPEDIERIACALEELPAAVEVLAGAAASVAPLVADGADVTSVVGR